MLYYEIKKFKKKEFLAKILVKLVSIFLNNIDLIIKKLLINKYNFINILK